MTGPFQPSSTADGRAHGPFSITIADGLRASHVELAARWLVRLNELSPVPPTAVFPSASLLDHIPISSSTSPRTC